MAKNKITKTNAVRLLDQQNIEYSLMEYEIANNQIAGVSVAHKVGHPVSHVFKTLVATAGVKEYYVFVIPVEKELNLKTCAKVTNVKKIEMIPMKDLLSVTGYIRGGCSPIGMKKLLPTYIDESAIGLDYIIVSAGKIGMQIKLNPIDLKLVTGGEFAKLTD